jgi:F0F1-type ATP synthase assembly protein I
MPENALKEVLQKLREIHDSAPLKPESEKVGQKEQAELLAQIDIERRKHEVAGLAQDIAERKLYADKSFCLVRNWIYGVFVILLFQGFLSEQMALTTPWLSFVFSFKLSDSVLLAVVGATTASVIGLYVYVAKYLFPKR